MNNKAHLRPKDFDNNGDIIPMSMKEEKGDLVSRKLTDAICEDKACKYRANERPQGEWIDHSCYKDVIICSNCKCGDYRWHKDFKFCPNCGADMQKGGAK